MRKGSIHHAFAMAAGEFEAAFTRIRASAITHGDEPSSVEHMPGPGMTPGARGPGQAVYLKDPSGHVLEIKTY